MIIVDFSNFEKLFQRLDEIENKIEQNNKGEALENYFLSSDEAMKYLKLSRKTLYKLRDKGKLKYSKVNRKILYRMLDLNQYLESRRI